jgi:hypothetical protein
LYTILLPLHDIVQTVGGEALQDSEMPRFLFQVQQDKFPETPAIEDILSDGHAAQKTALGMCADLAKDIITGLTADSEWRLNVFDESGKSIFRLRLLAESPEQ